LVCTFGGSMCSTATSRTSFVDGAGCGPASLAGHEQAARDRAGDEERQGEPAEVVDLDGLCRLAAREMIATALEAERRAYLEAHADQVDGDGKRLVVGNGHARERQVTTAVGRVEVSAPRVDDRREGEKFTSALLPPYMRKTPKVAEVLPILYLRGMSTGDFTPALEGFFGSSAGLSPSTVQRLTESWRVEHAEWAARDLGEVDYVYVWADGVYVNVRLPDADGAQDRLCLLGIVVVRPDGSKELVAVADGHREDTGSWLKVLRDLRRRGIRVSALAVADGALGFWGALRQVFPAPPNSGVGCTRPPTSSPRCPSAPIPRPSGCWPTSLPPTPAATPSRPPTASPPTSPPIPRRPPRSPASSTSCWRSTMSRASTGATCAPPTPSSRRLPPSGCASA
jgi:hypothetical protein